MTPKHITLSEIRFYYSLRNRSAQLARAISTFAANLSADQQRLIKRLTTVTVRGKQKELIVYVQLSFNYRNKWYKSTRPGNYTTNYADENRRIGSRFSFDVPYEDRDIYSKATRIVRRFAYRFWHEREKRNCIRLQPLGNGNRIYRRVAAVA